MRALFFWYVILMPFMSALAPSEWLPLPLILALCASPIVIAKRWGPPFGTLICMDAGFIVSFALATIGLINSPISLGSKNANYLAAFLITYGVFFAIVRAWVGSVDVSWALIRRASDACLTILSMAVIVEFILASFFGVFLSDLIPYAHDNLPIAELVSSDFRRPRAFAAEPGFTALAYEALLPLTFIERRSVTAFRFRNWLYLVAFLLLGSAAAMFCMSLAAIAVWTIHQRSSALLLKFVLAIVIVAAILNFTTIGQEVFWSIVGRKIDVATALSEEGGDSVTLIDRISTYTTGLSLLKQFPFGIGFGTIAQAFATGEGLPTVGQLRGSGMLSLYLDVAVAGGVLGVAAFLVFVGRRFIVASNSERPEAKYVLMGLVAVSTHHLLITELQYPFIWFSLALADKLANIDLDRGSLRI